MWNSDVKAKTTHQAEMYTSTQTILFNEYQCIGLAVK